MKKTMNMKKTFAAVLAASMAASASVAGNQDLIESKVDSINAKRGMELGGSIRGVAQSSSFNTDQDPKALNKFPNVEKAEFVTADLVFGFRPYENVRANAVLRLEAGMQEYFASAAKSISVPWINVEGNLGKNFYWVVGDFRQQYSNLTLFMPGIEIMYEPQIFARQRYMAQKEQFIEGNQRNLQGVNLQFRADINESLGEVRAEGIFARLNRNAVLDLGGAEGNILPNDTVAGATQANNMDKWLVAGNLEWLPFNKATYIGATAMLIFDNEDTYSYTYRRPDYDYSRPYERVSINPYDVKPQNTFIMSGRVGADIARMSGNSNLILDAVAEFALSSDDVYVPDSTWALAYDEDGNPIMEDKLVLGADGNYAVDEAGNPMTHQVQSFARDDNEENILVQGEFDKRTLDGVGLVINANIGYKTDSWSVRLAVDGVFNDSNWFNNAAQSPSFFAQRIMNSDKDGQTVKYSVNSPLYSTFDALYSFNPKFSPVATTMGTDDDAFKGSDVNSYSIADYNKNSNTANIYTRNQLALLETLSDPALQMSLPNGLATSNRLGGRANLIVGIGDFAEIQGLFSIFQQVSPLTQKVYDDYGTYDAFGNLVRTSVSLNYKAASYMEFGGGAKVDIFKALGFSKPLEISGSYKHSERSLETDGWEGVTAPAGVVADENGGLVANAFFFEDEKTTLTSDFINAGLYVQYLPRLGVNAGFQMINTEFKGLNQLGDLANKTDGSVSAPLMKGTQMQWMVGLDYNIASNCWLAVNFGIISVSNEYNTVLAVGTDAEGNPVADYSGVKNLPDYISSTDGLTGTYKHEFTQTVLEASLNVEF